MADSYVTFAADYDWLFDDDVLTDGGAINHPAAARLLQRTGPGRTVLDASCGTGINAAALARRGFDVWATDGSEAMIEQAAARFRREQLAIPVRRSLWADLPRTLAERFDVVLCVGNSLVHAAGRDAMVEALTGLRRMARPGGHVVIDSRNWEKLNAERRIVQVANRVLTRHGRRCLSFYAWEIPDRLHDEHVAHIVFVFEDGDLGRDARVPDLVPPLHRRRAARTTRARGPAGGRQRLRRLPRPVLPDRGGGPGMTELRTAHTADLGAAEKAAIRSLMDAAFDGVSDDTFDNVLGGVHALILEDGELIGHGSVVQRRMLHAGRALRTGYIEGVAVRADRRRQGHGARLMAALERIVRSAYELGALGASPEGARLYASRGWQLWRGPSSAMTPDGIRPTPGAEESSTCCRCRSRSTCPASSPATSARLAVVKPAA